MIPLNIMKHTKCNIPYKVGINSISDLKDGFDPGLDTICEGILNNKEFIFKAEKYLD